MNILDVIIVLVVISAIFRGREIGLVRQLLSTSGFIGGLFIGAMLQPYTVTLVESAVSRSIVTLLTTLGSAFLLMAIGEYVGVTLKSKLLERPIDRVDKIFGSVIGSVTILAAIWLAASIILTLPIQGGQSYIRDSQIISALNKNLPPAPSVIGGIGRLIDPNGFPQVFLGNEPDLPANTTIPGIDPALQQAINRTKVSVVKLEGLGCGGVVDGSGFVIGQDLVVTNAHVIAGVSKPYVKDTNGQHTATPVWFDPDLDFAIVRADNLAGPPLPIVNEIARRDTLGAVLGYPGGGPLTAGGAQVVDNFTARGRDIYGGGFTERQVYSLATRVIPGNSGGPVIDSEGRVIGVIFAQSTVYESIGYALSTPQLMSAISQAQAQSRAISTGSCPE